jgi:hypothetical protein
VFSYIYFVLLPINKRMGRIKDRGTKRVRGKTPRVLLVSEDGENQRQGDKESQRKNSPRSPCLRGWGESKTGGQRESEEKLPAFSLSQRMGRIKDRGTKRVRGKTPRVLLVSASLHLLSQALIYDFVSPPQQQNRSAD